MRILVTGGAGFIGSHAALSFCESGHDVVVLDNFINGHPEAVRRVSKLTGKQIPLIEADVNDTRIVERVLEEYGIESVVHFAGLKAVGESSKKPLSYYRNNVSGMISLLEAMDAKGVKRLVFSSSATIYGENAPVPYVESFGRGIVSNPYGSTKSINEKILEDLSYSDPSWQIINLRYFNPIGAHPSGEIGEDPQGVPNNLMPFISQVAVGRREKLIVFGGDYDTPDGTCRRDYLHVMDLAEGHLAALENLKPGCFAFNLGTGKSLSVLEIIRAFESVTARAVPFEVTGRREGDLPEFWADVSEASSKLGWEAKRNLEQMVADTWRWQMNNPMGYHKK